MIFRDRLAKATNPDRVLQTMMDGIIELNGVRYALDKQRARWKPGEPLKLLLAGYAGSRNTGSDIRPEEMIRQFRTIFGDDNLELSVLTVDPALTSSYFRTARQVQLPLLFPPFLAEECPKHHGVIAVEGSMFKSKFANAVTIMMAGALGMAASERKLSVGYGGEAGAMDDDLAAFVGRHCKRSMVICRNEPSRDILENLGVRSLSGTDTAWTFRPDPVEKGAEKLRRMGWDGKQPVLGVGPINPFWWPVKPDLVKAFAHRFEGHFKDLHYRSVYFHQWDDSDKQKYERYIAGFASFLERFVRERNYFPILFGMEKLDRKSCEDVASRLSFDVPVVVSDEFDMYELVSILHNCSLLVSSRFHALVTSMLGTVPSAGVTMDERITNLMNDRGHRDLFLSVEEEDLGEKLHDMMCRLEERSEQVKRDIERFIPSQLAMLGQMGIDLEDEVLRVYPEFPKRKVERSWENYLPPLSATVRRMLEQHG